MSCDEFASPYEHRTQRAKQEHTCCECRGKIQPGEEYHRHGGVWYGEWGVYKVCWDCEALREQIDAGVTDASARTAFTQLHEAVFEQRGRPRAAEFVAIKRKRGGRIEPWMLKYEVPAKA